MSIRTHHKHFLSLLALSSSFSIAVAQEKLPNIEWSDSVIETDEEGESILIIPMEGQMHTDVHNSVYKDLVDQIKELEPDLMLIEIFNRDFRNEFDQLMGWGDREEFNGYDKKDLVALATIFHVDLKDINQVAWVKDASGTSTAVALSWPTLYMSSDGWLHASTQVSKQFDYINAADTHGKIREAVLAHGKAFATFGGRDAALIRAFMDPDVPLSGTWDGKIVKWEESLNGDFILDPGEQVMPHLDATTATEVAISKGVVLNRNDLLLAQGIREYHIVGEDITQAIIDHKEQWRVDFDRASELWLDAQQFSTWAVGDDAARYLREQLKTVKRVKKMMEASPAVAMRMGWKHRINIEYLDQLIEQIEEQLRQLKEGGTGRGGGSGGRGPIGGGGGGGN